MFDYTLLHWTSFLSVAIVLNLSPGPDMAYVLGQTAQHGRKGGFAALFGLWTGGFGHVIMAAFGITAIVATSPTAFSCVKLAGAAYLIWMGVQALRSPGGLLQVRAKAENQPCDEIFRRGIIVAILNPKLAVFFMVFLPQFVVVDAGPVWAQLLLHGALIYLVAAFIEPPCVILGARLVAALRNNPQVSRNLDGGIGLLLITLGTKLAVVPN